MVDPSLKEEVACVGKVTVVVSTHGQVCAVQKLGGLGLSLSQVGVIIIPARMLEKLWCDVG